MKKMILVPLPTGIEDTPEIRAQLQAWCEGKTVQNERSDEDYAIEHAEYLAKAAEFYLDTRNLADAASDDEEAFDPQRLYDANNALRSAIYEFRKRSAQPRSRKGEYDRKRKIREKDV
jgi:hypothetical protein